MPYEDTSGKCSIPLINLPQALPMGLATSSFELPYDFLHFIEKSIMYRITVFTKVPVTDGGG